MHLSTSVANGGDSFACHRPSMPAATFERITLLGVPFPRGSSCWMLIALNRIVRAGRDPATAAARFGLELIYLLPNRLLRFQVARGPADAWGWPQYRLLTKQSADMGRA